MSAKRTLSRRGVGWEAALYAHQAILVMLREGAVEREGWTDADMLAVQERVEAIAEQIIKRAPLPPEGWVA